MAGPTTPPECLSVSGGGRCCWKPHQAGGHGNLREEAMHQRHNSHQRSNSHSHGSRSVRHNENYKERNDSMTQQTAIGIQSSKEATHNDGEQLAWLLWTERQMDVLTDTEMPVRCTDTPKRPQDTWGCTDTPKSPGHMGNIEEHTDVQGYGEYRCMGHTNIQSVDECTGGIQMYGGIWMPPKLTTPMPASNIGKHPIYN